MSSPSGVLASGTPTLDTPSYMQVLRLPRAARLVGFAERSGAPLAALLDAEADRARMLVLADARREAAVLAARLLLPLGALVLPAFLLAGALPIGLAVLSSTVLSW